jgi:DNA replication protein DnaC
MDEQDNNAACAACGGTGFVLTERQGQTVAGLCACRHRAAPKLSLDAALEAARVPRRFRSCDFESFHDIGPHSFSLRRAKSAALDYVNGFPDNDKGLLFMGRPGVGKTHLAVAIVRGLIEKMSVAAFFYDVQDLLRQIQSTFDRDSGMSESELLEPVVGSELLILDDLGVRAPTAWALETLNHIITVRYNEKRATIVTTNLLDEAPDEAAAGRSGVAGKEADGAKRIRPALLSDSIGPRMRSKLYEMCSVVHIDAQDARQHVSSADHRPRPFRDRGENA